MKTVLQTESRNGIPTVTCEEVNRNLGKVRLIDVRRPDEFTGELGHIPGAELISLGPELMDFLDSGDPNQEIVFICRSGGRSAQATAMSLELGFKLTVNMEGGMVKWNELGLPR